MLAPGSLVTSSFLPGDLVVLDPHQRLGQRSLSRIVGNVNVDNPIVVRMQEGELALVITELHAMHFGRYECLVLVNGKFGWIISSDLVST
jgi:hypothetical protein